MTHHPKPDPINLNLTQVHWTVSSYSGGGGDCVQAAPHPTTTGFILLGDSKRPHQPPLTIHRSTWNAFLQETAQQPEATA
ncbi:DUF397 domain-containing protein [Streptomyces sp. NPDC020875]|uniref:DUF397 domain-containing protein n=1 Tax=Streptomyces sp. NPDC020875 TaxID=3154898 RepID=UPI00340AABE6